MLSCAGKNIHIVDSLISGQAARAYDSASRFEIQSDRLQYTTQRSTA